jgi:hypothetical protein
MLANPTNIQQTVAVRGSDISLDFIDASAKFMTFKAEYFFSKNADFWMSRMSHDIQGRVFLFEECRLLDESNYAK